jgi:hypothetical protein
MRCLSASAAPLIFLSLGLAVACPPAGAEGYTAELTPLNAEAIGQSATGTATFNIEGGRLTITLEADGLAPNMMHLQHYHGFPDGTDATCPTSAADTNGDGIIDLLETEPMAGTTMVPFHAEPASLEIPSKTYPTADAEGSIRYEQAVAVGELQEALRSKFNGAGLDLDKRVVFIHGMAPDAELPESAQSLPVCPRRSRSRPRAVPSSGPADYRFLAAALISAGATFPKRARSRRETAGGYHNPAAPSP